MKSALYTGTVMHARRSPHDNVFSYPVYMALLDLDEFRANAASKQPEMLAWLHSTEPVTTVIVEKR